MTVDTIGVRQEALFKALFAIAGLPGLAPRQVYEVAVSFAIAFAKACRVDEVTFRLDVTRAWTGLQVAVKEPPKADAPGAP